jgi:hypothetical protein
MAAIGTSVAMNLAGAGSTAAAATAGTGAAAAGGGLLARLLPPVALAAGAFAIERDRQAEMDLTDRNSRASRENRFWNGMGNPLGFGTADDDPSSEAALLVAQQTLGELVKNRKAAERTERNTRSQGATPGEL